MLPSRKRGILRALPAEWFGIRLSGRSMLPALRPGDRVRISRRSRYRRGDILAFEQNGQLKIHRLIGYEGEEYSRLLLRGDNCRHTDPPVEPGDVLGCVRSVERSGRSIALESWPHKTLRLLSRVTLRGRPLTSLLTAVDRRARGVWTCGPERGDV